MAFQFENTAKAGPFEMYRGETEADGVTPITETRQFSDYIVPTNGEYRLKVTGFALPERVPIKPEFREPGGAETKEETKLELEITSERGKGHRWVCNYVTFSLGNSSNLFKIYAAAVVGEDAKTAAKTVGSIRTYDDMIGKEFEAYVKVADKRDEKTGKPIRAMLAWDTIKPAGDADDDAYDPFLSAMAG